MTLSTVVEFYADLSPVIVLFTDGVEGGDASRKTLDEVADRYAAHDPPVPVIVLELRPKPETAFRRTRDPGLVDDARRIYQDLLAVTEDAARRSVLNHRIQQLWLSQGGQ